MEHKDHNIMSGQGVTDAEYIEMMGAPAELAGTPALNEWMIEKVYQENIVLDTEGNIKDGMQPEKARAAAMKSSSINRQAAQMMLSKVMKERGF